MSVQPTLSVAMITSLTNTGKGLTFWILRVQPTSTVDGIIVKHRKGDSHSGCVFSPPCQSMGSSCNTGEIHTHYMGVQPTLSVNGIMSNTEEELTSWMGVQPTMSFNGIMSNTEGGLTVWMCVHQLMGLCQTLSHWRGTHHLDGVQPTLSVDEIMSESNTGEVLTV